MKLYLRLVGPAVLAALAAINTIVGAGADGRPVLHLGPELIAVAACVLVVALRKSLLIGLVLAAGSIAILRALGIAPLP